MFLINDPGPRNQIEIFCQLSDVGQYGGWGSSNGTFTWVCPSDVNDEVPMRVSVWGAGGCSGSYHSSGACHGGGGGGLAISEFTPVAGQSYTVTVGHPGVTYNSRAGTSSFAGAGITTVSAYGGQGGDATGNPPGNPNATGESSNPQNGDYGNGGIGVNGNVVNRRGGRGGTSNNNSSSGYGGGGASAPGPDGKRDGFRGGNGYTSYGSGSGGSIAYDGTYGDHYRAPGGAGTAGKGVFPHQSSSYYSYGGGGGAGLMGAGGRGANANSYSNDTRDQTEAGDGKGGALWLPNQIQLGGGGGGGGCAQHDGSQMASSCSGCGGPGAGGGAGPVYNSSNSNSYICAGNGGVLGGGGGAPQYGIPGHGGIAGGGGGCGYDRYSTTSYHYTEGAMGQGGPGMVVIQYAINV